MEYLALYISALFLAYSAFASLKTCVKIYKNGVIELFNDSLNRLLKVKYDLAKHVGLNKSQSIMVFIYITVAIMRISATFIVLKYIIQTTS